jgi:cathepsin B
LKSYPPLLTYSLLLGAMSTTHACFVLLMVASHVHHVSGDQDVSCSAASPDDKCDNLPVDETNLLQTGIKAHYHHSKPKVKRSYAHGPFPSRPFLEYFQHWSKGVIVNGLAKEVPPHHRPHVGQQSLVQSEERTEVTVARMTELVREHQAKNCPSSASLFNSGSQHLVLHNASIGKVQHVLLRSSNHRLQYLAESNGRLLAADPRVCPKWTTAFLQESPLADGLPGPGAMEIDEGTGAETSLEPTEDPLVLDCVKLLKRTVEENCNKSYKVDVFSAVVKIIDGMEVEMTASLEGPEGTTTYHDLECAFETEAGNEDAELLQIGPLLEEAAGYVATLIMEEDICVADAHSDISQEEAESMSFLMKRPLGLLSRYKGYEHVHDKFPMITSLLSTETQPESYDIRETYPSCFPDDGKEVVRDQGSCGSCWAFAGATSIMTNLCVSASQSTLKSADDRFEISVQQLMSCNNKDNGCDGGHMDGLVSGVKGAGGLAKERDSTYACGGGDPIKHFEESSGDACKQYPWGGHCDTSIVHGAWKFGFPIRVSGEPNMCHILLTGNTLWVGFDVYDNFKGEKDGIYMEASGAKRGGHAVVLVGFGVSSSVKYWTMQNSWGSSWADDGFYKVVRGNNIAGIEDEAIFIRVWVDGQDEPPCYEPERCTALTSGGEHPTCATVKANGWCDVFGGSPGDSCPVSCGKCTGSTPGLPGGSPSASPSPPATTTTTTTTTPPADKKACITDHTDLFGGAYDCVMENTCDVDLKFKCPDLSCTHTISPGGYMLYSCNEKSQTKICKGECQVWAA